MEIVGPFLGESRGQRITRLKKEIQFWHRWVLRAIDRKDSDETVADLADFMGRAWREMDEAMDWPVSKLFARDPKILIQEV